MEGGRGTGDRQPDRQAVVQKRMLGKKDKRYDSTGKFLYTTPQFVGM